MSSLHERFNEQARQALKFCTPHPMDSTILETNDVKGITAVHSPNVKALIWHRAIPEDMVTDLENKTADEIERIADQYPFSSLHPIVTRPFIGTTGRNDLLPRRRLKNNLGEPLYRDISTLNQALIKKLGAQSIGACLLGTGNVKAIGKGHTQHIHVDIKGFEVRAHISYAGAGLEWLPGDITTSEYRRLHALFHSDQFPDHITFECTDNGDVTLFKGLSGNFKSRTDDGVNGLVHRTPNPEQSPDGRLAYIADPVF